MGAGCISKIFFPRRKPRTRKAAGRGLEGGEERKKKVRWKRMYVGHVAAGIASMCHRGNHAGNAEAHLTTLPPCIYLPGLFRIYLLSPYFHKPCAHLLRPSRTVFYPPYLLPSSSTATVPRHVLQRNSRDAEIRTRKYGKPKLSSHSNNADWLDLREEPRLAHFNCAIFFDARIL